MPKMTKKTILSTEEEPESGVRCYINRRPINLETISVSTAGRVLPAALLLVTHLREVACNHRKYGTLICPHCRGRGQLDIFRLCPLCDGARFVSEDLLIKNLLDSKREVQTLVAKVEHYEKRIEEIERNAKESRGGVAGGPVRTENPGGISRDACCCGICLIEAIRESENDAEA